MAAAPGSGQPGILLKQDLAKGLQSERHEIPDGDPCARLRAGRGAPICGSGIGGRLAANRIPGIGAAPARKPVRLSLEARFSRPGRCRRSLEMVKALEVRHSDG
jgi:hypothetical protein